MLQTIVTYTQRVTTATVGNTIDLAVAIKSYPLLSMSDDTDVGARLILEEEDGPPLSIRKGTNRAWNLEAYYNLKPSLMSLHKQCVPICRYVSAKIVYDADVSDVELTVRSFNVLRSTHAVAKVEIVEK